MVSPHDIYFDVSPFWIQVRNFPIEYLNSSNVSTILNKVGRVVDVDVSIVEGGILRTFVRARVHVDVTKTLPSGCWVRGKIYQKSG